MKPRDWLDLADELATGSQEAHWRTAVSRAYYGAFHVARQLFRQAGFAVPRGEQAHGYLWLRLSNCEHPDVANAGTELNDLRRSRNWADYDLDLPLELARLRAGNAKLRGKLDAALKHRFVWRSECRPAPLDKEKNQSGRARLHGQSALPEQRERREVVRDLTEAEQLCPCCGRQRVCIGQQTAEQLDPEPARFFVLRTVKKS